MMRAARADVLRALFATAMVATLVASLVVGFPGTGRSESNDVVVEAETLTLPSSQGTVYSDDEASAGKALLVWTDGAATGTATTPKSERVVVRAKGDQCSGAPEMVVTVDGTEILRKAVKATWWVYHGIDVTLPEGAHELSVAFTNDYRTKKCDRNLRVDRVAFIAAPEPTPTPTPTPEPEPEPEGTALEAESMSLPSGSGQAFSDAEASDGAGLLIWSNAEAAAEVSVPASDGVVVRAKGDQCDGAPEMVVGVDGATVLTRAVSATTWTEYAAPVSLSKGTHTVSVAFTNDVYTSSCDRNLRVDRVSLSEASETLYVDPDSSAKQQAEEWRSTRPDDAAQMDKIAEQAQAFWFGDWNGDVRVAVDGVVTAADGRVPVLVAYNIPNRDCSGHSSGGTSPEEYRTWIRAFAEGIAARRAIVVLEPDALPLMDCLSATDQATRLELLDDAVDVFATRPGVSLYLDIGHSAWLSAAEAGSRLVAAGIAKAEGFSLNVSNFRATADEVVYGELVSAAAGGAHFVVDTSRNGLGPDPSGEWCNPPERALGPSPTLDTGRSLVDAYLWVKRPGESDGTCNGGPPAGEWWADYALGLAERAA